MRPDLIRLLVDTRRKELVTHSDQDGSIGRYSTQDRVGLSTPLDVQQSDAARPMKKMVPSTPLKKTNGVEDLAKANGVANGA